MITADDFGFSTERNDGVMEAFNNGAVKSASLLLNCTGTTNGVECAKNTGLTLGLHLNLTEGKPVEQTVYKTLTTPEGIFHGMLGTRSALEKGEIDISEIEIEIDRQLKRFEELVGKKPVYVDGHQHIHLHPVVAPIFAKALNRNGIFITRLPMEVNLDLKTWLQQDPKLLGCLHIFVKEARWAIPVLQENHIRASTCFTGLSTMGAFMTVERLQANILEAFESVEKDQAHGTVTCELMTHPGHPTPMNYGGFSWGTDDFGNSQDRIHETQILSSQEMQNFYKSRNIELVSHLAL